MFRSFFLKLLVFISAWVPSLYSSDCGLGYSSCLGSGFLIGGYATFHTFHFHTKDVVSIANAEQNLWEYEDTQRAPGGGGFIGYGISFCEQFTFAFKAAATGYASEAQHSYFDQTEFYSNKMRVKYIVDLSLEPGTKIGNCLLLYVKFGPSYVGWRQTRQIIDVDIPQPVFGEDKQHYHNWGYVFGVGANTLITRCMSAFAEFDWHSYPINTSKRRIDSSGGPGDFFEYRVTRLFGFGFRFGLMMQF